MELDIKSIDKQLNGLVDERYKAGMEMVVPTAWTIRGVRVPKLKTGRKN